MYKPSDKKNYLVSGVFITVLLVVTMITIFMLNKENPFFSSNINVSTQVKNAQNLKEGAAVQLRGIKVGSVKKIVFKNLESLEIQMSVDKSYQEWIRVDSKINFKTQGVLGDKFLEISGGTLENRMIANDDQLTAIEESTLDQILNKSDDIMGTTTNVLTKLDRILANVDEKRLDKILANLEQATGNANKMMSTLNEKKFNESLSSLKSSADSIAKLTGQIEKGPGTLHSLIYDQSLHEDLRSLVGGANRNKVLKFFIRESIKKNEN